MVHSVPEDSKVNSKFNQFPMPPMIGKYRAENISTIKYVKSGVKRRKEGERRRKVLGR